MNVVVRRLWLAIFSLLSTIIGSTAGLITWFAKQDLPAALFNGAGAFAAAMFLLFAAFAFLTDEKGR